MIPWLHIFSTSDIWKYTDNSRKDTIHQMSLRPLCASLRFGISEFYLHLSGLHHWYCGNHVSAVVHTMNVITHPCHNIHQKIIHTVWTSLCIVVIWHPTTLPLPFRVTSLHGTVAIIYVPQHTPWMWSLTRALAYIREWDTRFERRWFLYTQFVRQIIFHAFIIYTLVCTLCDHISMPYYTPQN